MNGLLAGLVILVIGDSHMVTNDYLITTLHDDLVQQGATVNSYGMCGTNAGDWVYKTTVSCGRGRAARHKAGRYRPQAAFARPGRWSD